MFKEKVNINTKQVWNLIKVYKLKDGTLRYGIQHKIDMTVKRVEYSQLVAIYRQGLSNNFMISTTSSGHESIRGKNGKVLTSTLNDKVLLNKRLTPLALLLDNRGSTSEVMLLDEHTDKKVRVTYAQFKELYSRGLVNNIELGKDNRILFSNDVVRFNPDGSVKLKNNQIKNIEDEKKVDSALTSKDTIAKATKQNPNRLDKIGSAVSEEEKEKELERLAKLDEKKKARELKKKIASRTSGESVEDRLKKGYEEAKAEGVFDEPEPEEETAEADKPKRCAYGSRTGSDYGRIINDLINKTFY